MLAAGHSVSFFYFRRLISDVAWPIVTKLCHVRWWPRFIKFGQKFGWPLPPKFGGPKTSKFRGDFGKLSDLIANISGTQQDIVNRKTALQTVDIPAQANLIRCTLVRKRRKIGQKFWPIQRAAIATHPVLLPRDAHSAKRGIAVVSRPSVCPSVRSWRRKRLGWTSLKIITWIIHE